MRTLQSIVILLVLSSIACSSGSIAISEQPSLIELCEQADLAFIGRVQHITVTETNTIYRFEVHEYIKESRDNFTFQIQLSGGLQVIVSPSSPQFEHGKRYLVFLVDDVRYTLLKGGYGRLLMDAVDSESLDVIRETYGSTTVYSLAGGVPMYNYTVYWENGTVTHTDPWVQKGVPNMEIDKIKPYTGIEFQLTLVVFLIVVLLSIFIVWLLSPN